MKSFSEAWFLSPKAININGLLTGSGKVTFLNDNGALLYYCA